MGVVSIHQFPIPEGKSGQQATELLQKRLETLGAVREGIFTVDCETYYSAPTINPSRSVNIIHDTEHPATCFALLDTGMCLVADITFDMLMLKMAGIYTSKKSTKIESRGPRYEIADFLVKVGSVCMGPSFRGILVEDEGPRRWHRRPEQLREELHGSDFCPAAFRRPPGVVARSMSMLRAMRRALEHCDAAFRTIAGAELCLRGAPGLPRMKAPEDGIDDRSSCEDKCTEPTSARHLFGDGGRPRHFAPGVVARSVPMLTAMRRAREHCGGALRSIAGDEFGAHRFVLTARYAGCDAFFFACDGSLRLAVVSMPAQQDIVGPPVREVVVSGLSPRMLELLIDLANQVSVHELVGLHNVREVLDAAEALDIATGLLTGTLPYRPCSRSLTSRSAHFISKDDGPIGRLMTCREVELYRHAYTVRPDQVLEH
ncbi:hypothetical protein HPB48_009000 [Haemaphysalis longicornis]|uniref:Mediator of RNA polymerase II transcription subunit 20 n=1 Tax=Haemaphysalis longicornis TaxID=44386 RepID=A0A9J6H464_HAELO|nr:hypothetical protein HPB48_009000 [Haemaphysalis longicornis]